MRRSNGRATGEDPKLKLSTTRMCVQCETLYSRMEKCPACGATGMHLTQWVPSSEGCPMVRRIAPKTVTQMRPPYNRQPGGSKE